MADIRGVILDVDGTLIDSNDAHAHAWVDALTEAGIQVEYDQVRRLIGMGSDKLTPKVSGIEKASEQGEQIADCREIFSTRYLSTLKPFPATRQMLERMRDAGLKLVVASSAEGEELDELLKIAGAEDLIEEQTSSSDASQSKPDPDIVRAAIESSRFTSGELLMLGDTPYDIEAADKAGVRTVALRAADLLANFDKSPFVKGDR